MLYNIMKKDEPYFRLFQCCVVVDGATRSLICDLQRKDFEFIPKDLSYILRKYDGKKVSDIKKIYENKFDNIIDEYFQYLDDNEFIFFTSTPSSFPKMKQDFYYPFDISNAIIDLGNSSSVNYTPNAIEQLDVLKCKNIELRFFYHIRINEIKKILDTVHFQNGVLSSIGIYFPYYNIEKKELDLFLEETSRLNYVVLHNSPCKEVYQTTHNKKHVIHITEEIINEKKCGIIDPYLFTPNIKSFTESINHNSCLNRKISIDKEGNIKNCPSMPQSFGNIKDTTLEEALNHPDFKKYWNVTKDQIAVCKDCEFRHICTDCRAYTERTHFEGDIDLSKPLKCGYNPYTNEWAEWSTNPLKQKAVEYYDFSEKDFL